MPLALTPAMLRARTARDMIRAVRSSPGSDRDKKELINAWYDLHNFERKNRLNRAQAVRELWSIDPADLAEQKRELARIDELDRGLASRIGRVVRNAKRRIHELVFGPRRLGRLSG